MTRLCDAATLYRMLSGTEEVAVLDVRELEPYGRGNILWSVNLPLGRLELDIARLVPRRSTSIVLVDAGGGLAARAAGKLESFGYARVQVLAGGVDAWREAGHTLHHETEVAVKGFAGFAEHHARPETIDPDTLAGHLERGEDWVVLDSRPAPEYRRGNIPGSIDAPGAQSLRSFYDLVPDPNTHVVVNCATRTRGILGALMLREAGVPNPVKVLMNGTRGWDLAGHALERNAARMARAPSPAAREGAERGAREMAARAGIPCIGVEDLEAMRRDPERTTYLFDVRDPEEYETLHREDAINAPYGTLVMSPEGYFATLNARVVVMDDDGIRARVSATWLAHIGACEAFVLEDGLRRAQGSGAAGSGAALGLDRIDYRALEPAELARLVESGAALVVDLSRSAEYLRGHVPGAVWTLRSELARSLPGLAPAGRSLVLVSEDGQLAALASPEAEPLVAAEVKVLAGGMQRWRELGLPIESEPAELAAEPLDRWLQSGDRPNPERAQREYLAWETGLLERLERDGPIRFRNLLWR